MFEQKELIVDKEGRNEDTVMEDSLEAGASDFQTDGDVFVIETAPEDFSAVLDALTNKGYEFISAEVEMVPSTYTEITDDEIASQNAKDCWILWKTMTMYKMYGTTGRIRWMRNLV